MKTKILSIVIFLLITSFNIFSQKLVYSTYIGSSMEDGSNNWLKKFDVDSAGIIYFTSTTYHSDFPVTPNAYDKSYNGGNSIDGFEDIAIVQFDIAQNAPKYASYFGGSNGPEFTSQVLFINNRLYLVGNTGSSNFPVSNNTYDATFNGPVFRHADGYVARFDSNNLKYSTFIGTSGIDWMENVFINDNGEIIVTGSLKNWDELPATNLFSSEKLIDNGNACVMRLNPDGDSIISLTVLGPTWNTDAVRDSAGNIYMAGTTPSANFPVTELAYDTSHNGGNEYSQGDIFVTKLTPEGDQVLFSTFLGGSENENEPRICLDHSNNIIIFSNTASADFPLTEDALDTTFDGNKELYIAKLSNDGQKLMYSSFLGGNQKTQYGEFFGNIAKSKNGDIYLSGFTDASNHPLTANAIQSTNNGGTDIFITVFDSTLKNMNFSTLFGGKANENCIINVDDDGNIIGVGSTSSSDILTTPEAYDTTLNGNTDIMIFKISLTEDMVKTTGISLNKDTLILKPGEQYSLSAAITPENADFKKINWKSNKTIIATVDNNGLILAKNKGVAIITAQTAEGKHTDTCIVKVANTTSIGESHDLPFSIYPNPTTGQFTIFFDEAPIQEKRLDIYNLQGSLVLSKILSNTTIIDVDLTNRPNGIYLIKIIRNTETYQCRIIKE